MFLTIFRTLNPTSRVSDEAILLKAKYFSREVKRVAKQKKSWAQFKERHYEAFLSAVVDVAGVPDLSLHPDLLNDGKETSRKEESRKEESRKEEVERKIEGGEAVTRDGERKEVLREQKKKEVAEKLASAEQETGELEKEVKVLKE